MATEVLMPKLGLTMTEGTVDQWFKNEGDTVEKGEVVCTISSEKLTHDVEAPEAGVIYIVSAMVLSAAKDRHDLVAPATNHELTVRNEKGHIVSVPGFVR